MFRRITVEWEHYPALLKAELQPQDITFIPRPGECIFAPLRFSELGQSSLLLVDIKPLQELTMKTLVSYALQIEEPSKEVPGAAEIIDLNWGVVRRARAFFKGKLAADTEFSLGWPVIQRIDLDLDGRLETIRKFPAPKSIDPPDPTQIDLSQGFASVSRDLNNDGIYEVRE
jgi:hypothetical protein